jgi:hypothetical protein
MKTVCDGGGDISRSIFHPVLQTSHHNMVDSTTSPLVLASPSFLSMHPFTFWRFSQAARSQLTALEVMVVLFAVATSLRD